MEDNGPSSDIHLEQPSTASLASDNRSQALDMDVSEVDPVPIHSSEASLMSPIGLGSDLSPQQPNDTVYQTHTQPSPQDINW